ncbi:unnamed protein product [Urochloa humidicola]
MRGAGSHAPPVVSPKKPAQVSAIAASFPNPRRCNRHRPSASGPPARRLHLDALQRPRAWAGTSVFASGDPDACLVQVQPAGGPVAAVLL